MQARAQALCLSLLYGVCLGALAAQAPPPPKLEPLPEPPPPPPEIANDPELQPEITRVEREDQTIEEYRVNGRVTMMKVTPRNGRPYYLMPDGINGAFIRHDSLDSGLKVPLWLLFSW